MATVYYKGEKQRILVGYAVPPTLFDQAKRRVKKAVKDYDKINERLASYETEFKLYINKLASAAKDEGRLELDVTAREIAKELEDRIKTQEETGEPSGGEMNFFTFADQVIEELRKNKQHGLQFRFKTAAHKFKDFTGEDLPLSRITTGLLNDFYTEHLIKKLENRLNTAHVSFRNLRTIYRQAQAKFPELGDPFKDTVTRKRGESRKKGRLSLEDINRLVELNAKKGLPLGSSLDRSRDLFLFCYEAHGSRIGDIIALQWEENVEADMIKYTMGKTSTKVEAEITPLMRSILDKWRKLGRSEKYVFAAIPDYLVNTEALAVKIKSITALVNKDLKVVGKLAEITSVKPKNLTTHIARHSFAGHLYESDPDMRLVQEACRHKDIRVTAKYVGELGLGNLHQRLREFRAKQGKP